MITKKNKFVNRKIYKSCSGDLKFLSTFAGGNSCSSNKPCPWCNVQTKWKKDIDGCMRLVNPSESYGLGQIYTREEMELPQEVDEYMRMRQLRHSTDILCPPPLHFLLSFNTMLLKTITQKTWIVNYDSNKNSGSLSTAELTIDLSCRRIQTIITKIDEPPGRWDHNRQYNGGQIKKLLKMVRKD